MPGARLPVGAFLTALLIAAAGAGCQGDDPSSPTPATVRDSAGVRIVENASDGTADAPWRVAAEPDWRVGWDDTGPIFEQVYAGALLSDGRAVVADRGSGELTYLGVAGEVDAVAGGQGSGPGEFASLVNMVRLPGDSVLGASFDGRWNVFGPDGALARTMRYDRSGLFVLVPSGASADGDLLLTAFGWSARPDASGVPWFDAPVLRMSPDGSATDSLGWFAFAGRFMGPEGFARGRTTGERGWTGAWNGGWLWSANTDPEVRWYGFDGTLRQVARWQPERVRIDDAWWAAHTERYMAYLGQSPEMSEDVRRRVEDALAAERAVADREPVFGLMAVDQAGAAWLGDYGFLTEPPSAYTVVRADGTVLGRVAVPERCRVLDISETHLLCVQLDPFDVQAVARFALEKP